MNIPSTLKFTGKDTSIVGEGKNRILQSIQDKLKIRSYFNEFGKQDFSGELPSFFVGSFGYPNVSAGFLSTENYDNNDNPLLWSKEPDKYDLLKIVRLRSLLLNSKFSVNVKKILQNKTDIKEISMANKPVEAEVHLEKKPVFSISLNRDELPRGPSAPLKKLDITSNPKIPTFAEKIEGDDDLKASKAVITLFRKGFDEHYVSKVFSAGNLGLKGERKIVPTKWSITAVDDMIGLDFIRKDIRNYKEHDFAAFFGGYMGNYYLALILPGPWSYELFETYVGEGLQNPLNYESASDYEGPLGRKKYASNTVGGYYASRLAVLEYFKSVKRQGSVLMLRFITNEYWVPMGVWVVREASRKSISSKPLFFDSQVLLLRYAKLFASMKFGLDLDKIFGESRLMSHLKEQVSLNKYF